VDEAEIGAGRHGGRSGQDALAVAMDDAGAKREISTRCRYAQSEAIAGSVSV
jgi:hypothetical protein